jgi:hypothetical protein
MNIATRTEWCLRIGAAGCFLGHGAFGIITKPAWVPYFGVVGIPSEWAWVLMPVVGTVDILAGIMVLVSPRPIVLLYMTIWGLWTALLRPLAGESGFETLERAGNYGVPLALLLLYGLPRSPRELLRPYHGITKPISAATIGRVLLVSTSLLLFAHGALTAITDKPLFLQLYATIGIPASAASMIGVAEMILAAAVLAVPAPALLIGIAIWKLATEALFPVAGLPMWEFIERAGSYAAPVALVLLLGTSPFTRITFSRSST